MKRLLLLTCIPGLLSSCATHRPGKVRITSTSIPGNTLPSAGVESVRYSENIKAYPMNRYIDPSNRLVMHEGHTVYRVETTPHWNLHPNVPVALPLGPVRANPSSRRASPMSDELIMEMNRQKAATKTLIQGTSVVSSKLNELSHGLEQTQQLAKEAQAMKEQVDATSQRMQTLEQELKLRASPPAPSTPATPATDDLNWKKPFPPKCGTNQATEPNPHP